MKKEAFSIFDIFREEGIISEAGEDDNQENQTTDDTNPAEEAPAEDDAPTDNGSDDDFDIDASLDDDSTTDDNGEDNTEGDDISSSDTSSSGGAPAEDPESEVNKDNTDIFAALTAEEQQIKIKELKNLYQNMYSSCDEILNRINNLDTDESNLQIITRLSYSMYDLKKYIGDYLTITFPQKSYVENDIAFNRFLMIIRSITDILEKYQKKVEKDQNS